MELGRFALRRLQIALLIIYAIICSVGLPLIFIFPPRKYFLFKKDSIEDENKKYLFKNFVSEIYNNINMPLIRNITYTNENEECPYDYEMLQIQHQHYGTFSKFLRNSSFCIKRNNNNEWKFQTLLNKNETKCEQGKKPCGIINKVTKALLCIKEDEWCPLNDIIETNNQEDISFKIINEKYLVPVYNNTNAGLLINDIDFAYYNNELCLEKFQRFEEKDTDCDFFENECYIKDDNTSTKIALEMFSELTPKNLLEKNAQNMKINNINFCPNALTYKFYMFSKSFVNFDKKDLDNFLEEFQSEEKDNPLSQICETYKTKGNLETLFYYFACILFCWSILHLVIQILVVIFIERIDLLLLIRKIFLINGFILFFVKLICFGTLLVSHYDFYLNFKAVFLEIKNDSRNEILNQYNEMRNKCIYKIFGICLVGFFTILVELIILCFVMTYSLNSIIKNGEKDKQKDLPKGGGEKENDMAGKKNNENNILQIKTMDNSNNNSNNENKINIQFIFLNNEETRKYCQMEVGKEENFSDIERKLKEQYSEEIGDKKIRFSHDNNPINNLQTVEENNIKDGQVIIVHIIN